MKKIILGGALILITGALSLQTKVSNSKPITALPSLLSATAKKDLGGAD